MGETEKLYDVCSCDLDINVQLKMVPHLMLSENLQVVLEEVLSVDMTSHLDPGSLASDKICSGNAQVSEEISIASSDREVEIVGVQEHARRVHPRGGVIQSVSSWKHGSGSQYVTAQQTPSWTAVTPQQNWSSPPEAVDLPLDEGTRRKDRL